MNAELAQLRVALLRKRLRAASPWRPIPSARMQSPRLYGDVLQTQRHEVAGSRCRDSASKAADDGRRAAFRCSRLGGMVDVQASDRCGCDA